MRNNVYKIQMQCTYKDGGKFTASVAVAAKNAESAIKKARAEQKKEAGVWRNSGMFFTVTDFTSVEKVAENLIA